MIPHWGLFPFGRPNTVRPARPATRPAKAIVVGVYPSAWHVTWTRPAFAADRGDTGGVRALAVDVEPTVFWDGAVDDFSSRLEAWIDLVGFVAGDEPGQHGHVARKSPSANGSSGGKVVRRYLQPMGLEDGDAAFTDVCPVFHVKSAGRARTPRKREQGDAIRDEYDAVAPLLGKLACTLPRRIPPARMPTVATENFRQRIANDLIENTAPIVVTLGEEVWATLLKLPELQPRSPVVEFSELYGDRYGETGSLTIAGRTATWLPLVHPGLLAGPAHDVALEPWKRTPAGWNMLHSRWEQRLQSSR